MGKTSNIKRAFKIKRIIYSLLGLSFMLIGFSYLLNPLFGITGFVINGASATTNGLLGFLFSTAGFFFLSKTRKRKKGQATMEFLMTYGWAILSVIIAMSTLMFLGIFSLSPPSTFVVTPPFSAESSSIDLSSLTIEIKNNGGEAYTIQQDTTITNLPEGVTCGDIPTSIPISSDSNAIINFVCTGQNIGDTISVDIIISYTKAGSGLTQTSTGTMTNTVTATGPQCSDGIDNDNDGLIDVADPGCWDDETDPFTYNVNEDEAGETPQCDDDKDNNGDGRCDFDGSPGSPGCNGEPDPNCESPNDISEVYAGGASTECSDGVDNDGDVVIDSLDPGCLDINDVYNPALNDESAATTECQDGEDNDENGFCDIISGECTDGSTPGDTGCQNPWDNDESGGVQAPLTDCSDDIDNEVDGFKDQFDAGCWNIEEGVGDPGEEDWNVLLTSEITECQDGFDNELPSGDGFTDSADKGCWLDIEDSGSYNVQDINELTLCQDNIDNDGNGWVDEEDPSCWDVIDDPGTYNQHEGEKITLDFECSDGIDNELPPHDDNLIDANDPDCDDATDIETPECSDGIDNDGDTFCDADGICDIGNINGYGIFNPLASEGTTPDPECIGLCDAFWDNELFCSP